MAICGGIQARSEVRLRVPGGWRTVAPGSRVQMLCGNSVMEWRIGCSGYHYPEWKRVFYPEDYSQRKWFEFYCEHFNTLELNGTYYKFPRVESMRSWYERSPAAFTFSVKAPRHITHFKKFRDARQMLNDFYKATRAGLSEKLGCVLFQFPASFHYDQERLERITDLLDASVTNVLEFRHESWWTSAVNETLAGVNAAFCGMSHPSLPDSPVATTDTLYYRFHGVPHLYDSRYDVSTLEQTAQQIAAHPQLSHAYLYFNNTAQGHAVHNARELQEISELVH